MFAVETEFGGPLRLGFTAGARLEGGRIPEEFPGPAPRGGTGSVPLESLGGVQFPGGGLTTGVLGALGVFGVLTGDADMPDWTPGAEAVAPELELPV